MTTYFSCDAFTNKGTFLKCIYEYVSYYERYVIPNGLDFSQKISVAKEGCFHVRFELTKQQAEIITKTWI